MLSRVAERLYWMARYLERTECTARICNAYSQLILDLPKGEELGWQVLVDVVDGEEAFASKYQQIDERNVIKFLLLDKDHASSILQSVLAARENLRTTRDVLPADGWEHVNELYLFVTSLNEKSMARRRRHECLSEIVQRNQQINGLLTSTIARDRAFTFLKLGQLIERLDMTSRVIDVACFAMDKKQHSSSSTEALLWRCILTALSAHSAYRREVGPVVDRDAVIQCALMHEKFPRSLHYCLNSLEQVLGFLNNGEKPTKMVTTLRAKLLKNTHDAVNLHDFLDTFQYELSMLNDAIGSTWFGLHAEDAPSQKALFAQ